jgi:hypothetical protein
MMRGEVLRFEFQDKTATLAPEVLLDKKLFGKDAKFLSLFKIPPLEFARQVIAKIYFLSRFSAFPLYFVVSMRFIIVVIYILVYADGVRLAEKDSAFRVVLEEIRQEGFVSEHHSIRQFAQTG